MKSRLEQGYWCFRSPPRGLIYTKVPIHGKLLVSDEPLTAIYKETIERFEKDMLNTPEQARQFTLLKYKEHNIDKPLSIHGMESILSELLYTGYIEYQPWGIPLQKGKHTGFISLETHHNVLAKLFGKKRKQIRQDYNPDFPLRGFVLCDVCGKPMTAAWCQGRSNKYPKYWCKDKECSYGSKSVPKTTIEDDFIALLDGVKLDSVKAQLILRVLSKTWGEEKESVSMLKLNAERNKHGLNEKIANLSKIISGTKDDDLLIAYETQLKEFIMQRKSVANPTPIEEYTEEEFRTASDMVFGILEEPVRVWKNPRYENKATIVQMYFPNRLSYRVNEGFRTVEIEPTIKLINSLDPSKIPFVEMPGVEPGSEKTPVIQEFSQG